jgi:hypothetical protein
MSDAIERVRSAAIRFNRLPPRFEPLLESIADARVVRARATPGQSSA